MKPDDGYYSDGKRLIERLDAFRDTCIGWQIGQTGRHGGWLCVVAHDEDPIEALCIGALPTSIGHRLIGPCLEAARALVRDPQIRMNESAVRGNDVIASFGGFDGRANAAFAALVLLCRGQLTAEEVQDLARENYYLSRAYGCWGDLFSNPGFPEAA